jgi:YcxB-like protein
MKMNLQFDITETEYQEFLQITLKNQFKHKWLIYFGVALVFVVVNFWATASDGGKSNSEASNVNMSDLLSWFIPFVLLIGLWIWLLRRGIFSKIFNIQTRDKAIILGQRQMSITSESVIMKMKTSETTYSWDGFLKWQQTPKLYLLYLMSNMAILIPKRAFESEAEQAAFEALLKEKVSLDK